MRLTTNIFSQLERKIEEENKILKGEEQKKHSIREKRNKVELNEGVDGGNGWKMRYLSLSGSNFLGLEETNVLDSTNVFLFLNLLFFFLKENM